MTKRGTTLVRWLRSVASLRSQSHVAPLGRTAWLVVLGLAVGTASQLSFADDDDAAIERAYDLYQQQTYTPTPFPRPELWEDAKWVLGAKNAKVKDYDVSQLVDPSFVQSAVDRGLNK